jgi:hypothetical protein
VDDWLTERCAEAIAAGISNQVAKGLIHRGCVTSWFARGGTIHDFLVPNLQHDHDKKVGGVLVPTGACLGPAVRLRQLRDHPPAGRGGDAEVASQQEVAQTAAAPCGSARRENWLTTGLSSITQTPSRPAPERGDRGVEA